MPKRQTSIRRLSAAAIEGERAQGHFRYPANHDWRATASGFQFLPRRKGTLTLCFHNFEREIRQSLRAPLGSALRERRLSLHNHRSRPFSKYSAQAGGSTKVRLDRNLVYMRTYREHNSYSDDMAVQGQPPMSYDLDLFFDRDRRSRILQYFAARKHFKVENDKVVYGHEDTGVYFFMRLRSGRNILLQRTVVCAEFEINYGRPSYFGIEAEKEMAAFVGRFSRGSTIRKCVAWATDRIHVTAFSMVRISAACSPSTALYLATPIGASPHCRRTDCAQTGSGTIIVTNGTGAGRVLCADHHVLSHRRTFEPRRRLADRKPDFAAES